MFGPGMLGLLDRAFSSAPTTNCQKTKLEKLKDLDDFDSITLIYVAQVMMIYPYEQWV